MIAEGHVSLAKIYKVLFALLLISRKIMGEIDRQTDNHPQYIEVNGLEICPLLCRSKKRKEPKLQKSMKDADLCCMFS